MPYHSKKLLSILLVFCIITISAGCSGKRYDVSPAKNLEASVTENWNQYKQAHGLPVGGMAVYLETPSGSYYASSGMPVGVDHNSRFRIASNTKTFTAAAIMLLEQQGKLRIDDTIVSPIPGRGIPYVPETAQYNIPYKASITIRQLLSHTAGVFDADNNPAPPNCPAPYAGKSYAEHVEASDPNHQFSPDDFAGVNATCQASHFAPGADYHYSDTGYSILAKIIERVSGTSYDQFLMQNLIIPNRLSSTSVVMLGTDKKIPSPFNPGYAYYKGQSQDVTEDNMSKHIGEGNITSTPADIARWVRRLIRGEAGPNSTAVKTMTAPTPQSVKRGGAYGLGIHHLSGLGYGHTGANQGYLSLMMYDPAADVTTIVYFNVWDIDNLLTGQFTLMKKAGLNARAAAGY
jgi:D-alanyl-D-alanine carboxypeptidase